MRNDDEKFAEDVKSGVVGDYNLSRRVFSLLLSQWLVACRYQRIVLYVRLCCREKSEEVGAWEQGYLSKT